MSKPVDSVLSNIARLAKSNLFQQLVSVVISYIRTHLLSPEHFGLWSLFNNILTHMNYFDLGLLNAVRYEIPKHQVTGDKEQLTIIQGTAFWGMSGISLVVIAIMLACLYLLELSDQQFYSLLIVIAIILFNIYHNQRINELRGYQEFSVISSTNYLEITLNAILTTGLVYYMGIYGAFLALAISMFFSNVFMFLRGTRVAYNRFDYSTFKKLIHFGFPIMMISITELLLKSLDRWLIAFYLGTQQLGYYGIGVMVLAPLLNIPGVSRNVLEPLLMQEITQSHDSEKARLFDKYLMTPLLQTACLTMPILSGIAFFALPAFVRVALPKYVPGIESVQILIIGSYFLALTFPVQGVVIVNKWQSKVAMLTLIPITFSITMNIFMIKQGLGIVGVALGTGLSFLLLAVLLLTFILFRLRRYLSGLIWKLLLIMSGFPLMVGAIYVAEYSSQYYELSIIFSQSIKIIVFMICYLPLPMFLWRANLLSVK